MTEQFLSPLETVESVAFSFAAEARERRVQITSFASPELPTILGGNADSISSALVILTRAALEKVDLAPNGSIMIEALYDKIPGSDFARFCVTDSRTYLDFDKAAAELSLLEKKVLNELKSVDAWANGIELVPDRELLGRATRFCIRFPLIRGHTQADQLTPNEVLRNKRIFLVANDPSPNRTIQHYARSAGIDLQGAPTAAETIVELGRVGSEEQHFDIVAVAPPIEDMEPIQIAQAIRDSSLSYLKLLYIAPWNDPADRLQHMEAGFDDTICKPFSRQQLFESFTRLAGRIRTVPNALPEVLVVEDNPINAQLAVFQLRKLGLTAAVVNNGLDAVIAVENGNFKAVLMDLQMPVMDGLEATREIRSLEKKLRRPRIPIIAITANDEWREEAFKAGCDSFLTKPAKQHELEGAVKPFIAQPASTPAVKEFGA